MLPAHSLFVNGNGKEASYVGSAINFNANKVVWTDSEQGSSSLYRQLVYKVSRSPKRLMFHVQRIYHCFDSRLPEQLYAALIDLFYTLKGKGRALSQRMVVEVMEVLDEPEAIKVRNYLVSYDENLLVGNHYSIFTTGLISSLAVIEEVSKNNTEYDVLSLAHDYIEYSQLEQAMEVLEGGILDMPKRLELQIELLELYTITKSYQAYKKMTDQLQKNKINITDEWQDAAKYFAELNNEE